MFIFWKHLSECWFQPPLTSYRSSNLKAWFLVNCSVSHLFHTPHPSVLFFNHHSASGRLPSRKGSPLPGLPPNPSAACPSAPCAAHSPVLPTTCRSAPCHSSLLYCGNIRHHCQPLPACVAKIILSRTLVGAGDVSSYQHVYVWSCRDRQAPVDADLSDTNFRDRREAAYYLPPLSK